MLQAVSNTQNEVVAILECETLFTAKDADLHACGGQCSQFQNQPNCFLYSSTQYSGFFYYPSSSLCRYLGNALTIANQCAHLWNVFLQICLDMFDKVDVLEYYDIEVSSARDLYPLPAVVRVRMYFKRSSPNGANHVNLSRKNVLLRDKHTCQYALLQFATVTVFCAPFCGTVT